MKNIVILLLLSITLLSSCERDSGAYISNQQIQRIQGA